MDPGRSDELTAMRDGAPAGGPTASRGRTSGLETPIVRETRSTCCYCGVGCGVVIEHDGQAITGVRGDPDHPANHGKLCSKGATLHLTARPAAMRMRATHPLVRSSRAAPLRR